MCGRLVPLRESLGDTPTSGSVVFMSQKLTDLSHDAESNLQHEYISSNQLVWVVIYIVYLS